MLMPALHIPSFPFCPERVQCRELAEECRVYGAGEYKSLWKRWHGQLHALHLEPPAAHGTGFPLPSRHTSPEPASSPPAPVCRLAPNLAPPARAQHAPAREEQGILCLWLDESVERVVDGLWKSSPSLAYGAHLLALELCMEALRALLPEAAFNALPQGSGYCAPLAVPDAGQAHELRKYGILAAGPETGQKTPALLRRYVVLTWMPFRGGCISCALRCGCPRQ